jgi:hypothetical protein
MMEPTDTLPATDVEYGEGTWLTPLDWSDGPDIDYGAPITDEVQPEHPYPYPSGLP